MRAAFRVFSPVLQTQIAYRDGADRLPASRRVLSNFCVDNQVLQHYLKWSAEYADLLTEVPRPVVSGTCSQLRSYLACSVLLYSTVKLIPRQYLYWTSDLPGQTGRQTSAGEMPAEQGDRKQGQADRPIEHNRRTWSSFIV